MEIDKLFLTIKQELIKYNELSNKFGKNDIMVKRLCVKILGMQEAFQIVAHKSFSDYLIEKYNKM